MVERRVATRPIDTNAAAMADAALLHLTGGQPIREDQDELQKLWMDAYIANGGGYREVDGGGSPDSPVQPCPKEITLSPVSVTFWTSHRLLKDEESDWTDTGALLVAPDWTPSRSQPVSHSMGEPIGVDVEIGVDGRGGPETARIVGKIQGETYFDSGPILFEPGKVATVTMVSLQTVIERVREQMVDIVWRVWTDTSYCEWTTLFTSSNRWFTTIGEPKKHGETAHGVTVKRMAAAVDWVANAKSNESERIVRFLMGIMGEYTLRPDPAAKPDGHPGYHIRNKGGAWAHLDHIAKDAECQAIVRLVQKLLRQVGAEGETDLRLVYALPDAPTKALEDTAVDGPLFGADKTFDPDAKTAVALVDQRLSASHVTMRFPPSHHPLAGGATAPGFNAFEACMRFEAPDGTVLYFPGGMGGEPRPDAQAVLDEAFQTMARTQLAPWPDPKTGPEAGRRILEILWDYPSGSATPPP